MPLTKQQKQEAVAKIAERLEAANTLYFTDAAGLSVADATTLRRAFREADIDFKVLKNTLLRRAMEDRGGYDAIFEYLHGPTAIAFSNEPALPAKVLQKFLKGRDKELPRLKAAFVDGAVFTGGQLDQLAALKGKDELIADILALLLSPIKNVVGAVSGQGSQLAGAIQTLAEREG